MSFHRAAICVAIVLALGCASLKDYQKAKSFDKTSRAYSDALQWSDFHAAQTFLKISSSEESPPDLEDLKLIRIVNYDIQQAYPSGDKQRIHRVVTITYYRSNESVVKELTHNEVWEYDEISERWLLTSGFPEFK
jgi:hypothetical protein